MNLESPAQLRLYRQLVDIARLSPPEAIAILTAYDKEQGEDVAALALPFFDWIATETQALTDLAVTDEDEGFSEFVVEEVMRSVAIAVHAFAHARHQAGLSAGAVEDPAVILLTLERVERRYRDLLLDTRVAAETGTPGLLHNVLQEALALVGTDIGFIAQAIARQDETVKADRLTAVRVASVARRCAMLCAGCLHLLYRLTNTRKAAGLRQVAEARTTLARNQRDMLAALTEVQALDPGRVLRLSARCEAISWVDDGDGYTSITVQAGALTELRLGRRNALRAGLAAGAWLYVKGPLKEEAGAPFLDVEQVAITTHAATIWEDYLIAQVRPAYDLAPGSIDMAWAFPDLGKMGARNDLHGRL